MADFGSIILRKVLNPLDRIVRQSERRANAPGFRRFLGIANNSSPEIVAEARFTVLRFGTEARKFYRSQLVKDIDVTTRERTGKLKNSPNVVKRTRGLGIVLTYDFPATRVQWRSRSGRAGSGQYAFIVNAPNGGNRKFIQHAVGVTQGNLNTLLTRSKAIAAARFRSGGTDSA